VIRRTARMKCPNTVASSAQEIYGYRTAGKTQDEVQPVTANYRKVLLIDLQAAVGSVDKSAR
jgi:hypothetical protein